MRGLAVICLALSAGCLPDFPPLECVSDSECAATGGRCVDNACAGGFDAGAPEVGPTDAARPDAAGPDAARPDADSDAGDAGPEDLGPTDAGPADSGPDVGFVAQLGPSPLDFGAQPVGCLGPARDAIVQNLGVTTLEIREVSLAAGAGSAFTVEAPALPLRLGPAASARIPVRFAPRSEASARDTLRVRYQDPTPLRAALEGQGASMPLITERTEVRGGPLDVLFVVDNGTGAGALQARLGNQASPIVAGLEGFDYHLGITTTDASAGGARGALQGSPIVIDANRPRPSDALAMRLQVGQASGGPARGLDTALSALTPPLATGVNRGFLRTNAPLLVVLASERPDASSRSPAAHAAMLDAVNGNAPFLLNAIVPLTAGCALPSGGSGTVDARARDAVRAAAGVTVDVCAADWSAALDTLPAVPAVSRFPLEQRAVPGSVEVRVNGLRVPEGQVWDFEPAAQRVVFRAGREPDFGATVEIRYRARC